MRWVALWSVALAACTGGEGCEERAFSCDGQLLLQCVDGAEVEVSDCDVEGGMCMASMGHCHHDTMDSGMEM